ncbi:single-stranded-DNA-specific exonuclease RecJ [Candidatus Pelagibacter sp. HIMB1709]|uniref:single-stranded-DNA-specific exonuclease RecJ n=1 Tax=Candidatus Pelagibacter sp. HIMB1709 TaxID=3413367 RepID=UPI003F834220
MNSVSGKNWEEIKINLRLFNKLKTENNLPSIINKLILSRNFDEEEIYNIENNIELINPFLKTKDFEHVFKTLKKNIKNKEKIIIIGDYDVDGLVSTSLFIKFLKILDYPFNFYIPDRLTDGYGASLNLIKKILKKKPKLVVMLDCGSNSRDSVDLLNLNKIDTIIIDHHEVYEPYPVTKNFINPKKKCDYRNYSYFCSSALTYYLIDFYFKKENLTNTFKKNLIYVLLATVCDVMPLRYLNRVLAKSVLQNQKYFSDYVFRKILSISKKKHSLNIEDFAFLIGPIINSTGRIGDPNKAINLLISSDNEVIEKLTNELFFLNEKRKKIEENILKKINFSKSNFKNKDVIFLTLNSIHEGLIGIIASKIKDYFEKPCIIFTESGNNLKGSARSTENFNIGHLIKDGINKNIIKKGGGHNLAAGLLIEKNKLNQLKNFILTSYAKKIKNSFTKEYIAKISLSSINQNFFNDLSLMGPFGSNNQDPVFLIENVKVIKPKIIKNKFLSCILQSRQGKSVFAMSFNFINSEITNYLINYKKEIKILAQIKQNNWNNKKTIQLNILDVAI